MIVVVVVVVFVLKSAASAFVLPNAAPFYVFPPLSLHLSLSLSILSCFSDVCKIETGRQTERQEGRERESKTVAQRNTFIVYNILEVSRA